MKLYIDKLKEFNACEDAIVYFKANKLEGKELKICILKTLKDNHFGWCIWLLLRLMTYENQLKYAFFAIELIIDIYEKEYPSDGRPRKAIEATKTYQKNPTEKNRIAARSAAWSAAESALQIAARGATRSARIAARGAAWSAAWSAAWITESTESAAESDAESALQLAARSDTWIKIINYGLKILGEK